MAYDGPGAVDILTQSSHSDDSPESDADDGFERPEPLPKWVWAVIAGTVGFIVGFSAGGLLGTKYRFQLEQRIEQLEADGLNGDS